ncbi:hypothetical protein GCM10027615_38030 [Plantactinospora veratri]
MSVPVWDPPLPLAIGALPPLRGEANGRLGHGHPHQSYGKSGQAHDQLPISVFRLVRLVISALV